MKAKFSFFFVLVFSLVFFLGSCNKDTALQPVESALTVVMDNDITTLTKSQKTVTFDSGYIYVDRVDVYGELENEDGDNSGDSDNDSKSGDMENNDDNVLAQTIDVNTRIDLATGAYQVPITFELSQANYDDIKFFINLNSMAGYPSIEVYGTYYDINGNPVPVSFIYTDSLTIKTELDDDTDDVDEDLVVSDTVPAFVIHVSPAKWFKDVSADMLENATRVNGVILINDTTNVNILQAIIPNIGKEGHMEYESRERFENEYHQEHDD